MHVNPDRKMLLTLDLAQSYFVMLQKMVEKNFQNSSYKDDNVTNYVNFLKKICEKIIIFFFLRLTLRKLEKKFQDLFLAFESQNNMHIEYI